MSNADERERKKRNALRALAALPRNDVDAALTYYSDHIKGGGDPAEVESLRMLQDDDREFLRRFDEMTREPT